MRAPTRDAAGLARAASDPRAHAQVPGAPLSAALASSLLMERPAASLPWHYEHGLFLLAAGRAGEAHGLPGLSDAPLAFIDARVGGDGAIEGYRPDEHNLDQVNPGRLLLAHPDRASPRIQKALESLLGQLDTQPRCPSGGYWHKRIYPDQMWLDGLYMAEPFSVACGKRYGHAERFDEALFQFELMEAKARDGRTGLLYHAWDESRRQLWSRPDSGCSPHFWSRAIGWFAMALVDALDYLPAGHRGRPALASMLRRILKAVEPYQDGESGLWYQVMDLSGRRGNYLETSASAMFAYAGLKAARKGIVDDGAILACASRAYEGIARLMLHKESGVFELRGICAVAGLGGKPYRDGSFEYYIGEPVRANDHKGVGPFILACLEAEALGDPALAAKLRELEERA